MNKKTLKSKSNGTGDMAQWGSMHKIIIYSQYWGLYWDSHMLGGTLPLTYSPQPFPNVLI